MKIVYVNPAVYDYLSATLIEGLATLGHEVLTSQAATYGRQLPDDELRAAA